MGAYARVTDTEGNVVGLFETPPGWSRKQLAGSDRLNPPTMQGRPIRRMMRP
jgi:hypothetical protein